MAEASEKSPTLAEQYFVKEKQEKTEIDANPVEVKEVENPEEAASVEKTVEETPPVAEESSEVIPSAEQTTIPTTDASEVNNDATNNDVMTEESSGNTEEENGGDQEAAKETPEIKLETAPADFRFPTTNQTRHCFTRYVEYHRCIAAKGEGAPECEKFAKYYRSLCPGEWIDRWNEQRENGTFPGPL
ncbi:cytochrome c oxidase subunit 6b-1-like [Gastrolobium bilobum]|uniref:cytochrome c oxidase subunit 6b-1-like n=1 Tax=Gastrolobium bilobum TaxID=150636 RepID=UPI002AB1D22D|nr:cytochrome c oxidase subunit 6b-1-like [Gastrolobium bilobum]